MPLALALVALAAAASAAEDSASRPVPRVTLRWVDVHGSLAPAEFETMASDVTSLFREVGLDVAWARGEPGEGFEVRGAIEIPVIALRSRPARLGPAHVLGLVARDHDSPGPIWIFIDDVRWALGHSEGTPTERERATLDPEWVRSVRAGLAALEGGGKAEVADATPVIKSLRAVR